MTCSRTLCALPAVVMFCLATMVAGSASGAGPQPAADEILDRMDANLTFASRTATVKMRVEGKGRTRSFELITYGRGESDAAMEYLSPVREKGTRMLKLGDDLWIYMPAIERTQKISGHMLRQGMMGSDLSYEDMMTSEATRDTYGSTVAGSEVIDGRDCWKLEMITKDDSVSYPKRIAWIDKELYIPLKQELYALSGMLLKTWTMSDIIAFEGGRRFPTKMVIQDMVRKDSRTILEMSDMKFGVDLPAEVFSRRWIERGR